MINDIHIENYKSIKNMDLKMRAINILIGSNGAGKSNFISFFEFLKAIYDQRLGVFVGNEGYSDDILYFGSKVSNQLSCIIEFDEKNRYYFELRPNKDSKFFFSREGTCFNKAWYGHNSWDDVPLSAGGNFESELKNRHDGRYNYVKQYMTSFKVFHFHDSSKTAKMRNPSQLNDNLFLREDGGNLPSCLYRIQKTYPKDFRKIEMTIRSIAPYFDQFMLQPDRINHEMIRLEWKEKDSDTYFNAKHLSDGTLRFIALAVLLLQPDPPKVIIIDEPELGLHPFAINKLAGLVKKVSLKSQIILSTQSVNLVDNFDPEDIITVDRKNRQSVFERHRSEELEGWLNEYSIGDLWNKNVIGGRP